MHHSANNATPVAVTRPTREWLQVLWSGTAPPFSLTAASMLCDIPGIRLSAAPDGCTGKLEIPRNAEQLAAVRPLLESLEQSSPCVTTVGRSLHIDTNSVTRKPYDYQTAAAELALREGRLLLCDEMGLGKTTTTCLVLNEMQRDRRRPVLIVGPKIMRTVWQRELIALGFLRDADDEGWLALTGTDTSKLDLSDRAFPRFVYCHYEILRAWWNVLMLWRISAIALDEAHKCKNPKSERGRSAQLVTTGAPMRMVLTGTPVLNRLGELHSLLTLVTGPWTFGAPSAFRMRYAGAVRDGYNLVDTEPTHVDELTARLAGIYVRRTKADVGLNLPGLRRQVIDVPLGEKALAKYKEKLDGHDPRAVVHALIHKGSQKALQWIGALRKISSSAKVDATVEHVSSILEQGGSAVVFTWQRETAERLARALAGDIALGAIAAHVHGGMPDAERIVQLDAFQARGGVLCATFGAIAEGVTLTRAANVVMHDLHEVPGIMLQAEARIWRIGQTQSVMSYWMVAQGTVDEIIAKIFERKGAAIAALGDNAPESLADMLGKDDVEAIFGSQDDLLAWAGKGSSW